MTLPRLRLLRSHWVKEPPTRWLLAAFIGYKSPKGTTTDKPMPASALLNLSGMPGVSVVKGGAKEMLKLFDGIEQVKPT